MRIGSENEKLMKAVIERGILPSIAEVLKKLRDPSVEKDCCELEISGACTDMLSPLMMGDIFRSMDEIHAVALTHGMITLKYAADHPEEFDMEKLIEEMNDSMEKEGWS